MKRKQRLEITLEAVHRELFDIEDAAALTGIHPDLIREYLRGRLVSCRDLDPNGWPLFDESGICRLRLLHELREREKLSLRMMRIFCSLADRLERSEEEIRRLRNQRR